MVHVNPRQILKEYDLKLAFQFFSDIINDKKLIKILNLPTEKKFFIYSHCSAKSKYI